VEDLVHRATGAVREACAGGCCSEGVSDDVLRDRVRSKLGHLVTPPDHVETDVRRGVVALRGTASSTDREALLKGLRRIPGVRGVEDLLVATAV
jgi:osmotically-inducible protein OsmY